jgi:ElaB/YqjD/DUF883 family membrane-anchored ribosome-binding protein
MGANAEKEWDRVKHYGANELGDVLREALSMSDDLADECEALRAKVDTMEACIRAGDKLTEAVDESEEEGFECGAGVFFACEAYFAARRLVDMPAALASTPSDLSDEQVARATERFRERLRRMRKDIGHALDRAHEASGVVTQKDGEK